MYILHATHTQFGYIHKFIELFSSRELITTYLNNHPEVTKVEITYHDINPA